MTKYILRFAMVALGVLGAVSLGVAQPRPAVSAAHATAVPADDLVGSEERRVGEECRCGWSADD